MNATSVSRRILHSVACAVLAMFAASCNDFLQVNDPTVIDASSLDPARDASTAAFSAQQNLAIVYGALIVQSGWFAGEAQVADAGVDLNAFGRRDIAPENGTLTTLWRQLSAARAMGAEAFALAQAAGTGAEIHAARGALVTGFAFVFAAEQFCEGAVDGGPPLTTAMMLDSAVEWFGRALTSAGAVTSAKQRADADAIANAALVGRARAQLQAGRATLAANDAAAVTAGFEYRLAYVDDPSTRGRTGNPVWDLTSRRRVLSIAPAFRGLDDPRVSVIAPSASLLGVDGVTPFWAQAKYSGYASPIRLASRIEADYILAEAQGTSAILALVQARRGANGQRPYAGATDAASVRAELIRQRAREFFLEAKTLGDTRRHPGVAEYMPATGSAFHKAGFGPIGAQTCFPLPSRETDNNANFGERG